MIDDTLAIHVATNTKQYNRIPDNARSTGDHLGYLFPWLDANKMQGMNSLLLGFFSLVRMAFSEK